MDWRRSDAELASGRTIANSILPRGRRLDAAGRFLARIAAHAAEKSWPERYPGRNPRPGCAGALEAAFVCHLYRLRLSDLHSPLFLFRDDVDLLDRAAMVGTRRENDPGPDLGRDLPVPAADHAEAAWLQEND